MKKNEFHALVAKRPIILDGSTGTELVKRGLPAGACPEKWVIENIELLPETRENKVSIYNRWCSQVSEVANYNNDNNVFKGLNLNGGELPSGTYFYKIEFNNGQPTKTGYLVLKR